ncbi:MAG: PadR family transcriptional regulator [Micropruina sp.]
MVLGIVAQRGPMSGYGIDKTLDAWAVRRWATIAPASIYQQLKSMSAAGLIAPTDEYSGRAVSYQCTDAGRAELHTLLTSLLSEEDFQPLSLLPLLHFTPVLEPSELVEGLEHRIGVIDQALAHEQDIIAQAASLGPSHVLEVFRLTWHGLRADRHWCIEFLERLRTSESDPKESA